MKTLNFRPMPYKETEANPHTAIPDLANGWPMVCVYSLP